MLKSSYHKDMTTEGSPGFGPEQQAAIQSTLARISGLHKAPDLEVGELLGQFEQLDLIGATAHPAIASALRAEGKIPEVADRVRSDLEIARSTGGSEAITRFERLGALMGVEPLVAQPAASAPIEGLGGAVRRVLGKVGEHLKPLPADRRSEAEKSLVEKTNDFLAGTDQHEAELPVSPAGLTQFLQELPMPQGASLQNLNLQIQDGQTVLARGDISRMGTTSFNVTLETGTDGFLQVSSINLKLARLHKGAENEIRNGLGNLIPDLKDQLNRQLADKAWKTAGFSISEDGKDFVLKFNRRLTDQEKEQNKAREGIGKTLGSLKVWAKHLGLERIGIIDYARERFKDENPSEEKLESYVGEQREQMAGWVSAGKVSPDDANINIQELFALLGDADGDAIKAIIGQKLGEAGEASDELWVSAWREYLSPPAAFVVPTYDSPEFDALVASLGGVAAEPAPVAEESIGGGFKTVVGADQPLDLAAKAGSVPAVEESNRVETLFAELRQAFRRKPDETLDMINQREELKDQLQLQLNQTLGLLQDDRYLSQEEYREWLRRRESLFIGNDQQLKDLVSDPQQAQLARRLFAQGPVELQETFEAFVTYRDDLLGLQELLQQLGRKTYITILRQAEEARGRKCMSSFDRFDCWEKFGELLRQEQEPLPSDDELKEAFIKSNQASRDEMQVKEADVKSINQFMADLAQKASVEIVSKGGWRFELKEIESVEQASLIGSPLPPEIAEDPELSGIYHGILQQGGNEMGENFLEAARRMMENEPGLDLKTAASRLITGEFRRTDG